MLVFLLILVSMLGVEPIVNSPEDAFKCFMNTEMDYLVINNFLYKKEKQNINFNKIEFVKD